MRKNFNSILKNRRSKRTTTTATAITTTAATNDSGSESYDDMLLTPNDKDSIDITQDLIDLDLSDDDTIADYEPGGDD